MEIKPIWLNMESERDRARVVSFFSRSNATVCCVVYSVLRVMGFVSPLWGRTFEQAIVEICKSDGGSEDVAES